MKKILSLDLGITTGWCVCSTLGEAQVEGAGTIIYYSGEQVEEELTGILLEYHPSYFVVEAPVIVRGELGDKLQEVVAATKRVLRQGAEWIQPSDWKQLAIRLPNSLRGRTQHERDAYRMAQWWLITNA